MHLVTVNSPLKRGALLRVGSYLAEDTNAAELLTLNPSQISLQHFDNPKPLDALHFVLANNTAKPRILIVRPGGYGDLLFLAAAIHAFKQQNASAHVAVATFPEMACVFENNADVAETVEYPVPLHVAETFDALVFLEHTVEDEREQHAVDLFMDHLGVDPAMIPAEEKRCIYHPTDAELSAALSGWPRRTGFEHKPGNIVPRVGVQVNASTMNRTYPHAALSHVLQMLHEKSGWEIFLFGAPKSLKIAEADRLVNLTTRGLDFRKSAAVLTTCDVVLAPDSALTHLAGALDLPCVALYGPFPYELRTKYHPKTFALSSKHKHACAPCFHFGSRREPWPANGPCAQTGKCEVLWDITPARVANKIVSLYKAGQQIAQQRTEAIAQ